MWNNKEYIAHRAKMGQILFPALLNLEYASQSVGIIYFNCENTTPCECAHFLDFPQRIEDGCLRSPDLQLDDD